MYNYETVVTNQANNIYEHKNTKNKILNCNANIFFNQQSLKEISTVIM